MACMKEIPVIDLYGKTSYEIGVMHGEILRDKIHEFFDTAYELHRRNLPVVADMNALMAFCERNIGYLKKYSTELFEEMRGIAKGSGMQLTEILFLNSFLELEDLRPSELGGKLLGTKLWGCTTFNVLPTASRERKPFIGQTFDMEEYYSKFNVILRIHREGAPAMLVYSIAGVLGLNGINEEGIAVVINKLVANDAREGVSYPFLIRNALAQRRIGDAFGAIVFAPRATGMNYQLSSDANVAWCVEVSASYYNLLPIDGAISHTNHYLSDMMRKYETPGWLSHGGSYVRHQVSSRILKENIGQIDLDLLMKLTRDHTNEPRCICAHGFAGQDECDSFATIAAMIYDPKERCMYACHQNPCTNEYIRIDMAL